MIVVLKLFEYYEVNSFLVVMFKINCIVVMKLVMDISILVMLMLNSLNVKYVVI